MVLLRKPAEESLNQRHDLPEKQAGQTYAVTYSKRGRYNDYDDSIFIS